MRWWLGFLRFLGYRVAQPRTLAWDEAILAQRRRNARLSQTIEFKVERGTPLPLSHAAQLARLHDRWGDFTWTDDGWYKLYPGRVYDSKGGTT